MSVPLRVFYCSKCSFENTFTRQGKSYAYKLRNGDTISAPIEPGWCVICNSVEKIHCGLSPKTLENEIDHLNQELKRILGRKLFFRFHSRYEREEINKIKDKIEKNKKYLSLLDGSSSLHTCLKCGGNEVFPIIFGNGKTAWPDTTSYTHINCGGQIKLKDTSVRFMFKRETIFIEPNFPVIENNSVETSFSINDIPNFSFITELIDKLLNSERSLLENNSLNHFGFKCDNIFDHSYDRHFMVERFLFIYSFLRYESNSMSLELMKKYVARISSKVYGISLEDATNFVDQRIQFYIAEMDFLGKAKHPHSGKIIWSLYNPTCQILTHDLESCFESNLAGGTLIQNIVGVLRNELVNYSINRN